MVAAETTAPVRAPALGSPAPRRRLAIGLDAAAVTGLGVIDIDTSRMVAVRRLDTEAAAWTEERAIGLLDELLGDAEWCAALERPFGNSRAVRMKLRTAPPTGPAKAWARILAHLARRRAARTGVRFLKPLVLRPKPDAWRKMLGIRTSGDVKAAALAYVAQALGVEGITDHNAAEGLCLAEYMARIARYGAAERTSTGARAGGAIAVHFVR